MLCAIATYAEIEALPFAIVFLPDILAASFPALRDGIADKRDIAFPWILAGASQHFLRAGYRFAIAGYGDNGGIGPRDSRCGRGSILSK
jgi:hypothetical protein